MEMFHYIVVILAVFITNSISTTWTTTDNNSNLTTNVINIILSDIKDYLPVLIKDNNVLNFSAAIAEYKLASQNEDLHLNITQLIEKNGYPVEQHEITTSDGYIITFFRIPSKGSPVLLMHGLEGSSSDWVSTGKDRGLAYILAAAGYDVWLGNARGNVFGRRHIDLSPDHAEFWDFSWNEIGQIDVPETIDYILKSTDYSKLNYIGHSQGTTVYFVMCSTKPEYNEKISLGIALAPSTWFTGVRGPAVLLGKIYSALWLTISLTGNFEFLGRNAFTDAISNYVCETPEKAAIFCNNIVLLTSGFNYPQVNVSYLPSFYAHAPAGASSKQIIHYAQSINTKKFRQFNYGIKENIKRYGSRSPSDYHIKKVTAPTIIFHADNDWLSSPADVDILAGKLPNLVEKYRIPDKLFTHIDYVLANNAVSLVYNKILSYLSQYGSS